MASAQRQFQQVKPALANCRRERFKIFAAGKDVGFKPARCRGNHFKATVYLKSPLPVGLCFMLFVAGLTHATASNAGIVTPSGAMAKYPIACFLLAAPT